MRRQHGDDAESAKTRAKSTTSARTNVCSRYFSYSYMANRVALNCVCGVDPEADVGECEISIRDVDVFPRNGECEGAYVWGLKSPLELGTRRKEKEMGRLPDSLAGEL